MERTLLLYVLPSVIGVFIGVWLTQLNWGKPFEWINMYLEYRALRKTWNNCPLLGSCQYCEQPKEFKGRYFCSLSGREVELDCPRFK